MDILGNVKNSFHSSIAEIRVAGNSDKEMKEEK